MTKITKLTKLILLLACGRFADSGFTIETMHHSIIVNGFLPIQPRKGRVKELCCALASRGLFRCVDDYFFVKPHTDLAGLVQKLTTYLKVHGNIPVYYTGEEKNVFTIINGTNNKFISI